jgi:catechol 2,3-dioxygenase-like lactoylglutathione lyase family enzyme
MPIYAIDHIQLAMPPGEEDTARAFYVGVLGFTEVAKPADLAGRGGAWLEQGEVRLHLGIEPDFRPSKKAHPALLVDDLPALLERCREHGIEVTRDVPLEGYDRAHIRDPFGNRVELMQLSR